MTKKRLMIFLISLTVAVSGMVTIIINDFRQAKNVQAVGDLLITYSGVPLGGPVFNLTDYKPGDCTEREIKVENNGTETHRVFVKGVKTGGTGDEPLLESTLDMVITGEQNIYGSSPAKKVKQFFTDSANGLILSELKEGKSISFKFKVCFPIEAGNEFQKKSVIFDLIFGSPDQKQTNIKINEVYYSVDNKYGGDCDKIRKVNQSCKEPGWLNLLPSFLKNRNLPGLGSIFCGCSCSLGKCNEWVELYNPTDAAVNLKGWQLKDNSGKTNIISAKKIIPAHGFAIVAKDASIKLYWKIKPGTLLINLGNVIGDELDNSGDHLDLIDPLKNVVDRVGWGNDILVWNPAVTLVSTGASIGRLSPGFDNDLVTDWHEIIPPTPGN